MGNAVLTDIQYNGRDNHGDSWVATMVCVKADGSREPYPMRATYAFVKMNPVTFTVDHGHLWLWLPPSDEDMLLFNRQTHRLERRNGDELNRWMDSRYQRQILTEPDSFTFMVQDEPY